MYYTTMVRKSVIKVSHITTGNEIKYYEKTTLLIKIGDAAV